MLVAYEDKQTTMTEEQKVLVQSIEECWSQMYAVSEREAFIKRGRFAMMFVVDVFDYEPPKGTTSCFKVKKFSKIRENKKSLFTNGRKCGNIILCIYAKTVKRRSRPLPCLIKLISRRRAGRYYGTEHTL